MLTLSPKLSKDSFDEVQGHTDWSKIEVACNPLQLWIVIKKTHQILTTSKVGAVIKKLHVKNTWRVSKVNSKT
jgi:hypothetical protein